MNTTHQQEFEVEARTKRETHSQKINKSAVVVGLCSHGLALAHSLFDSGIPVYAVEANTNLPGFKTRCATVVEVSSVNGHRLVDELTALARKKHWHVSKPVLFLTNDDMVKHVVSRWEELQEYFDVPWSEQSCRDAILTVMDKANLAAICNKAGVLHPKSITIYESKDIGSDLDINFPAVVKPAWPMSSFKIEIVQGPTELSRIISEHPQSLPLILQEWIDGPENQLVFCSTYKDGLDFPNHIEGRKLLSFPRPGSQGTAFLVDENKELFALTQHFLAEIEYSGPIAVEYKIDSMGRYWLIEANLGRTEYCTKLCTANGFNIAKLQYERTAKVDLAGKRASQFRRAWLDTERDPYVWFRAIASEGFHQQLMFPTMPYGLLSDPLPYVQHKLASFRRRATRILRRLNLVKHRSKLDT